jgi:hydrogenase maturation protein HypF
MHEIKRVRFSFSGIVQGVGFRPFIYRIAVRSGLAGFVQNRTDGVIAEVEGVQTSIVSFKEAVRHELPPLAHITLLEEREVAPVGENDFRIIKSDHSGETNVHITPDIATCGACLNELFDPVDRRFNYPFINCTDCGPRLTIIKDIPYDRENTSMACFELCPECRKEYENPANRRFHAEPNACPVCGPRLKLFDSNGIEIMADPLSRTAELLKEGWIAAIKGIGGFHLCVDAENDKAVERLRSRKYREEKPLAIMVKDIVAAKLYAKISSEEENLLVSHQRPIVLLEKKPSLLSSMVAPGLSNLGIMLPYSPLHHLLFAEGFNALVMTSANQTDEPICTGNREAIERLKGIADYFLIHNRDILVRCDDSISFIAAGTPRIMRRSRGYAPTPVMLNSDYPGVLAMGPHLKATVCILKGNAAYLSPHIGDMETPVARDFYHENLEFMQEMTECRPDIIACDLHPGYYSTRIAESMGKPAYKVQHHHAHIVSSMAENGLSGKVIGIAFDGTGYGTDKTVWGGEFLIADEKDFIRAGHLNLFTLPGGEKAIREPWRIAVSLLRNAFGKKWRSYADKLGLIQDETSTIQIEKAMNIGLNNPATSSMGRLFDGISALTGLKRFVSFEGQAAMELESVSYNGSTYPYEYELDIKDDMIILQTDPMIRQIVSDIIHGAVPADIGGRFHTSIIMGTADVACRLREKYNLNRVALSGGCFQNRLLLEGAIKFLEKSGFDVYHHRLVPTNDGGISLGQAVSAAVRHRDLTQEKIFRERKKE